MSVDTKTIAESIKNLARAIKSLRAAEVIRSRYLFAELGEWYVEQLYEAERRRDSGRKGSDLRLPNGAVVLVETKSYDPKNRWSFLEFNTNLFDRLILVILTDDLTVRDLYDVPITDFIRVLRGGQEDMPSYYWDDLTPWRVDATKFPGYSAISGLIEG